MTSVSFSPDGQLIASGSSDLTVRLWDAKSGQQLNSLTGHTSGIKTVAFSPNGTTLAYGAWDNAIRLWGLTTPSTVPPTLLSGQTSSALSISKSSAGNYMFYCKVTDSASATANSNTITLTTLGDGNGNILTQILKQIQENPLALITVLAAAVAVIGGIWRLISYIIGVCRNRVKYYVRLIRKTYKEFKDEKGDCTTKLNSLRVDADNDRENNKLNKDQYDLIYQEIRKHMDMLEKYHSPTKEKGE